MSKQEGRPSIDQEVKRQINDMDERFERSGWFYLVVVVIVLFLAISLFMYFNNEEPDNSGSTFDEINQKVTDLENKVESLETRLNQVESN